MDLDSEPKNLSVPGESERGVASMAAPSAKTGRMSGPGGFYNLGNLIALTAGLWVQIVHRPTGESVLTAVQDHLAGATGPVWLTVSILIFLASGEIYHQAWRKPNGPEIRLNRLGDLISAIGAATLTVALVYLGDVFLAIVAGSLLAGGKLGTAIMPPAASGHTGRARLERSFRLAVVLSRLPSIAALAFELRRISVHGGEPGQVLLSSVMLGCFFLWLWADLLLMRGDRTASARGPRQALAGKSPVRRDRSVHHG